MSGGWQNREDYSKRCYFIQNSNSECSTVKCPESHSCDSPRVALHFDFILGVGLYFVLRASYLQSRSSTAWTTPPVHFARVTLEMGVSICPGWHQTAILPILASRVAKIPGVSRQLPSLQFDFWHLSKRCSEPKSKLAYTSLNDPLTA
jgi:hypothetical protein